MSASVKSASKVFSVLSVFSVVKWDSAGCPTQPKDGCVGRLAGIVIYPEAILHRENAGADGIPTSRITCENCHHEVAQRPRDLLFVRTINNAGAPPFVGDRVGTNLHRCHPERSARPRNSDRMVRGRASAQSKDLLFAGPPTTRVPGRHTTDNWLLSFVITRPRSDRGTCCSFGPPTTCRLILSY